jgi:lysosomal acid lipase/cholesteryl ester hydrolase
MLLLLLLLPAWGLAGQKHTPKHDLETDTMITLAGYKSEAHKVVTEDKYILTIHRIVGTGPVVFMQHGLEDSSSAMVLAGTDHGAPAFRLAEQGYDVWLGNFRGNHYCREHAVWNADTDNEFWQFAWDEMAKYDLPSMLNYVIEITGKEKIYFVGHSLGTSTFMAMNSMDQSWADKIELAVLLAPVAYVDHMQSPLKYIAPFSDQIQWIMDMGHMGIGEFLPSSWLMDWLAAFVCDEDNPLEAICENIVFLISGYDKEQMNATMMPSIVSHIPAGTSSYAILQFAQEIKHKRFGGMDWGPEGNLLHHGSEIPPLYNLSDVNTKVALFWGNNDWLSSETDLFKIITQVPNIVENYQVPWEGTCNNGLCGWNHFDFLYAIDIDEYQNNHLIEVLARFPID